jgi:hypothetical protein
MTRDAYGRDVVASAHSGLAKSTGCCPPPYPLPSEWEGDEYLSSHSPGPLHPDARCPTPATRKRHVDRLPPFANPTPDARPDPRRPRFVSADRQ